VSELAEITCPKCGYYSSTEVIYATTNTRKGWYCPNCSKFTPATGRERLLEKPGTDSANYQADYPEKSQKICGEATDETSH
jgi:transposase-like protein